MVIRPGAALLAALLALPAAAQDAGWPEPPPPPPPPAPPAAAPPPPAATGPSYLQLEEEQGPGWAVVLQLWGGVQHYDVLGLSHAFNANGGRDLLSGNVRAMGASFVVRLGWFDVGVLYEGSILRSKTDSTVFTPFAGVGAQLTQNVRVDLVGELGGHQLSHVGASDGVSTTDSRNVWLPYAGLRPSLSLAVPIGRLRTLVTAAPYARWDLLGSKVNVSVRGFGGGIDSYDVGGVTYGVAFGFGIEL
jgi:hypothetical protein